MRPFCVLIFILFLSTSLYSDDSNLYKIDSLKRVLSHNISDSIETQVKYKLRKYYLEEIKRHLRNEEYEEGKKIIGEVEEVYNKEIDKSHLTWFYLSYADRLNDYKLYNKAIEYYTKSQKLANEIEDTKAQGVLYNNLSKVYIKLYNYSAALKNLTSGLEISKKYNSKWGQGFALMNIARFYEMLNNDSLAINYYREASIIQIEYYENTKIVGGKNSYFGIASIHMKNQNYDSALVYINYVYNNSIEKKDLGGQAWALQFIGELNEKMNNNKTALNYYNKSLNKWQLLKDNLGMAEVNNYISRIYYKNDNIQEALKKAKVAESICLNIDNDEVLSNIRENMSNIFLSIGDTTKAFNAYRFYKEYQDSSNSRANRNRLATQLMQREQEIELKRIEEESKLKADRIYRRNTIQYLGLGAIIIFIGFITLLQGKRNVHELLTRAMIFITFILLFEFLLIIIDPFADEISEGEPVIKFAINLGLALIIFPMHNYFEKKVSGRLLNNKK